MIRSDMRIRNATSDDLDAIVELAKLNRQFHTPTVDGKDALARVLSFKNNVFLVCISDVTVAGFIIGSWDGARAIIHKISVHPDHRGKGIGRSLVNKSAKMFRDMGAPTLGVTAADGTRDEQNNSIPFWEDLGFKSVAARLMVHFDLNELDGE